MVKILQKNSRIVICGLCRNIKDRLVKNIPKFENTGKLFKDYRVVIFENDSEDGTRELIKDWSQKNNKVVLLNCCNMNSCECRLNEREMYNIGIFSTERMKKMAFFRNQYLNYVKNNCSDFDYMLVVDMDMEGSYSNQGLFNCLSYDFDMMCINGKIPIPSTLGMAVLTYDALAFEKDNLKIKNNIGDSIYKYIQMNKLVYDKNNPIKIVSGFNGMAIYNIKSILNSQYDSKDNCEHIDFHKNMIENGYDKIFINPIWKGYFGFQGSRNSISSFFK